jgi:hypothetical protein
MGMFVRERRSWARKLLIWLSILALLAAGGFYWYSLYLYEPEPIDESTLINDQPTFDNNKSVLEDVPRANFTNTYESKNPAVQFEIPPTWDVTEAGDGIRMQSPEFSYSPVEGEEVVGHFRIYIRRGAREQDSNYIGRGLASRKSQKLTYTSPSSDQVPETNLSFFGLDSTDNFGYFFVAGNYSLRVGETLGASYGQEATTYIISGGYSSEDLADDMATHEVSLDYFYQTNAYKQAIDIIKSLKLL